MGANALLLKQPLQAVNQDDAKHQAKGYYINVCLMLLSKNNSTGVLIVQTVILLAVLAILIVVLVELVKISQA